MDKSQQMTEVEMWQLGVGLDESSYYVLHLRHRACGKVDIWPSWMVMVGVNHPHSLLIFQHILQTDVIGLDHEKHNKCVKQLPS